MVGFIQQDVPYMNLYKLHTNPEKLLGYKNKMKVPAIVWQSISRYSPRGYNDKFSQEQQEQFKSVLKTDAKYATEYAYKYMRGLRWPEAEPVIMKDPDSAVSYAYNVIDGKWPEAEQYIVKNPLAAFEYVEDAYDGRVPEFEPYIMKDPEAAYSYARFILDRKWPEAEQYIKQDKYWWKKYSQDWSVDE